MLQVSMQSIELSSGHLNITKTRRYSEGEKKWELRKISQCKSPVKPIVLNRFAKIHLSGPHWADMSCDLADLYNGDNVLHDHHMEGEQMAHVCLAFKTFNPTLSWSRGLLWLPPTPLAQAQVFPRPDTLCDCGIGFLFFSLQSEGKEKWERGLPPPPVTTTVPAHQHKNINSFWKVPLWRGSCEGEK